MKILSILLLSLASISTFAQSEGNGTGRTNVVGTSPTVYITGDSTVGLIKSSFGLRNTAVSPTNKTAWLRDAYMQGFIRSATGSAPDDSVLNFRDNTNALFKRIIPDGVYRAEWWIKGATDITVAMQRMMDALPPRAEVTFSDSAAYTISAMITRSKPIKIRVVGSSISFTQTTPYTSMFYFNSDSCTWEGGSIWQTGFGDENDFPRGYGAGIVFQDVQAGCAVRYTKIYNCGDYLHPGVLSPRDGTFGDPTKRTSSAAVYGTRSGFIDIYKNSFYRSITGVNTDGYQNKNIGTPGHKLISDNNVDHNYFEDCWQSVVFDGLDSAGLADAFPGWITNNTVVKTAFFTSQGVANSVGIKVFTNLSYRGTIIDGNHLQGRWGVGISCQTGSYHTQITNNILDSCYDGIAFVTAGRVVRYVNIANNKFSYSAHADINLNSSQQIKIHDNISTNALQYGMYMDAFSIDINMENNDISGAGKAGIVLISGYGYKITGGSIVNCGTDVTGDTAAISVNPAGTTGVLYNVEISGVKFDVPSTGGTPSLVQKYAIVTHGAYSSSNSFTWSGKFRDNFLGRCQINESLTEHTFGLLYRRNQGANAYDTATANIWQLPWDAATKSQLINTSTGAMAWTATGSSPALSLGFPTSINSLFTASGGLTSNATVANANFSYGGSTGVTGSTAIGDTAALQGTIAYHSRYGGSASLVATGTLIGGNVLHSRTDFTANGTSYIGFNVLDLPVTKNAASTGSVQHLSNHWIYGLPSGASVANSGLFLDRTAVEFRTSTPYGTSQKLLAIGNNGTSDSMLITVNNPGNLFRQVITAGTATTLAQADILVTFNPATPLASHTVTLPANPLDQQVVKFQAGGTITSGNVITSFNVLPNTGQQIVQSSTYTGLVAGLVIKYFIYQASTNQWFSQ
jgi:hypothetical protein